MVPAFCPHGGWLVATEPVPDDPADHWVSALRDVIGCNRIVCSACGARVRSARNLMPARGLGRRLVELGDTADCATSPLLVHTHATRFYACRCRSVEKAITRDLLEDPEPNPATDQGLPWACAGHPPPQLRGLPQAEEVSLAVATALGSSEPGDVGTALWFFRDWPHAAGSLEIDALAARVGADAEFPVPFFGRPRATSPADALAARSAGMSESRG